MKITYNDKTYKSEFDIGDVVLFTAIDRKLGTIIVASKIEYVKLDMFGKFYYALAGYGSNFEAEDLVKVV